MLPYIEWTKESIEQFLNDKLKRRGINPWEYEFLVTYLNKIQPEVIIDVGTFLGISGYILGTSSPKLEKLYAIENINDESFVVFNHDGKDIPKSDYGKYLPEYCDFRTHGYHNDLLSILKENEGKKTFVYLDAKKTMEGVLHELQICHEGKAKYIGMHDTSIWYKRPRRAMKQSIRLGWFELIDEAYIEDTGMKSKGVSILKGKE